MDRRPGSFGNVSALATEARLAVILGSMNRAAPLRVLVIEDYPDMAELFAKWIELAGHTARICHTGVQALQVAPTYQPHIVLLDIGLPDMYGWDLARSFRKDPSLAQTRIVAITAYRTQEDRRRSQQVGIDVHLGKPVLQSEITQLLSEHP